MLALIAHDQKKPALVEFVLRHRDVFERFSLVAAGVRSRIICSRKDRVMKRSAFLLLSLGWSVVCLSQVTAAERIAGIGPTGDVKKVHGGLMFTEGPAADREGNLYFSDVAGDK